MNRRHNVPPLPRTSRRALILGAAPLPLLAACSQTGPGAAPAAGTITGEVEITDWSAQFWEDAGKQFAERYPGAKLTVRVSPDSALPAYLAMLTALTAAGTPPDVMNVNNDQPSLLAGQGILQAVDPLLARDKADASVYHPGPFRTYQLGGKQYAVPATINPVGVYVNKALFKEAGVPLPPRDHKDTSWTIDAMFETAKRLTRTSTDGNAQWGMTLDTWIGRWFPFLWANGGDAFDAEVDPKKFTFLSKETETTLQWLADLRFRHRVAPQPADLEVPGTRAAQVVINRFREGRVAMLVEICSQMGGHMRAQGLEWDVAPVPRGPKGRMTRISGNALGLHPKSDNKDAAWSFIKFYTGKDTPMLTRDGYTQIPALKSITPNSPFFNWVSKDIKEFWLQTLDYGRNQPNHPKWQEAMESDTRTLYSEALDGKRSVKDALEGIKRYTDNLFK